MLKRLNAYKDKWKVSNKKIETSKKSSNKQIQEFSKELKMAIKSCLPRLLIPNFSHIYNSKYSNLLKSLKHRDMCLLKCSKRKRKIKKNKNSLQDWGHNKKRWNKLSEQSLDKYTKMKRTMFSKRLDLSSKINAENGLEKDNN